MDSYDRKVQKKGTSGFFVAVPSPIAHALGIEKGSTVRFWSVNGKAVFKPVAPDGLTKKDMIDIDKYEEAVRGIREELRAGTVGRGRRSARQAPGGSQPAKGGQKGPGPGSSHAAGGTSHAVREGQESEPRSGGQAPGGGRRPRSNAERLQRLRIG